MDYPLSYGLVVFSVLVAILLLSRFQNVFPEILSCFMRPRSGAAMERNLRLRQDRNLIAVALVIPFILLAYRYRLYNNHFFSTLDDNLRLAAIAGALIAYALLRRLLYKLQRPRRGNEYYKVAHRNAYTHFIVMVLFLLCTAGILSLAGVQDETIRIVLLVEAAVFYLLFLRSTAQILSLYCNSLRTFLYLCTLEILPAALLIVTAFVL